MILEVIPKTNKDDDIKANTRSYDTADITAYQYSYSKPVISDVFTNIVNNVSQKIQKIQQNTTLDRLKKSFTSAKCVKCVGLTDVNRIEINNNDGTNDIYYYEVIDGNYYIGDAQKTNKYNAINRLKQSIKYKDIIISVNDFKQVGIIETDIINNIKDMSSCEILMSYDNIQNVKYSLYLDIETSILKDKWLNNNITKCDNIIINSLNSIIKTLKANFQYVMNETDVYIADASGNDEKNEGFYRYSKHVSLPIYTRNIQDLYEIFSYFHYNIFKLDKYCFKGNCIFDNTVYLKSNKGTRKWRMLGQSKTSNKYRKLKAFKLDDFGYTTDVNTFNCVRFDDDNKYKVIDIGSFRTLLNKSLKNNHIEIDNNVDYFDALDTICLNIKKSNKIIYQYSNYADIFYNNNDETDNMMKAFYKCIINTQTNRQPKKVWDKILYCSKNIGKKYHNDENYYLNDFIIFTLNAYPDKQKSKAKDACIRLWNKIYEKSQVYNNKIGLNTLQNIASIIDKEIYLKLMYAIHYNTKFNINRYLSIKNLNIKEYVITDRNEKLRFKKRFLKEHNTFIINLNTGEGKTQATNDLSFHTDYYICISNRVLYAIDLTSKIQKLYGDDKNKKSVISYLDEGNFSIDLKKYPDFTLNNTSSLIVSLESLYKFIDFIKRDIIDKKKTFTLFLDEFETLYGNLVGETNQYPEETLKNLVYLWKKAHYRVVADAFLSTLGFNLFNTIRELAKSKDTPLYIHANNRNLYPKIYNIKCTSTGKQEKENVEKIISIDLKKNINDNKNVLMFCEYADIIHKNDDALKDFGIEKDKYQSITAKIKENASSQEFDIINNYMKNPNDLYNVRVFTYNTSILNGLSITINHFHRGMIVLGAFGVTANDAINASSRARQLFSFDVYSIMSFTSKQKALLYYDTDITKIQNKIYNRNISIYDIDETFNADEIQKIEKLNKYLKDVDDDILKCQVIFDNGEKMYFYKKDNVNNPIFHINMFEYEKYKKYGIIYQSILSKTINKLKCEYIQNIHFNNVFKTEIFIQLAKDKGNDVITSNNILDIDNDDKYENYFEDDRNDIDDIDDIDDNTSKNVLVKRNIKLLTYIKKHKHLNDYGTYHVKSIYEVNQDDDKTSSYISKKLLYNFENTELYEINDLWAFVNTSSCVKDIVDNLISINIKKNKDTKNINSLTFNHQYITSLFEILKTDLKNLSSFSIENIHLKKLYPTIHNIANMSRRFYKRQLPDNRYKTNEIYLCIKDINEILSPIHIKLKEDKILTIKKTLPNQTRYTSKTYKMDLSYSIEKTYNILRDYENEEYEDKTDKTDKRTENISLNDIINMMTQQPIINTDLTVNQDITSETIADLDFTDIKYSFIEDE